MTPETARTTGPGWTLRRRLNAAFATVAVLLVLLGAVVTVAVVNFVSASNAVIYRWQGAGAAQQQVLTDLVNQETGLRGYALGRAARFLGPYTEYLQRQQADDARLQRLTAGDPDLVRGVRTVDAAAAQWRSTVAVPLIADVHAGRRPTTAELDTGKAAFDRIRTAATALSRTLDSRAAGARTARARDGVFAAVAAGVAVVLVAVSGYLVRRGLHRWVLTPVDRLAAQTNEVSSGALERRIDADGPLELVLLGRDVDAMRTQIVGQLHDAQHAREELHARSAELARSNDDLQQFAYVASHDLSEPLRKVANFCQLLERQYAPQLDDRARQYIDFAVDGAKRMQVLITDLLALSRVGRTTESFIDLDLDAKLDQALANLGDRITAAGASVERLTPLPHVRGDRALLVSLFENLVGNAVKYRREDVAPVVRVGAERDTENGCWVVTISDNGIGIDPQYRERIFAVFQRLHLRDQYGGTGIGLALCRKIVEFHGGRIWLADVQSQHGQSEHGATFRFTLPESGLLAQPCD
jgi:signal transduction histidine kinase